MRLDLGKTARATAISIGVASVSGPLLSDYSSKLPSIYIFHFVIGFLLTVPLIILLLLLYSTGTMLSVSPRRRILAIATAAVYAALSITSDLFWRARFMWDTFRHMPSFRYFPGTSIAGRIGNWLWDAWSKNPWNQWSFFGLLVLAMDVAFTLFLITLYLQDQGKSASSERQARLVWSTARVANFAGWAMVVVNISWLAFSAVKHVRIYEGSIAPGAPMKWSFLLGYVRSEILSVCWAIAPWIVLQGLPAPEARQTSDCSPQGI
jgi:hypothetical protein